jgi:hypothetical protein
MTVKKPRVYSDQAWVRVGERPRPVTVCHRMNLVALPYSPSSDSNQGRWPLITFYSPASHELCAAPDRAQHKSKSHNDHCRWHRSGYRMTSFMDI